MEKAHLETPIQMRLELRPITSFFDCSKYAEKTREPREPPWLSGYVCAYHPAARGSIPKHNIFVY